jgi:hypothetical protein
MLTYFKDQLLLREVFREMKAHSEENKISRIKIIVILEPKLKFKATEKLS